jgi:beta-1,4-mannosyl-glycoprotein beta-1,4-N-acetylglucosaminyltransferase
MNSNLAGRQPKRIIDTFLFFNEIEMLKVRLEYLGPHVDYFVIAESDTDFSGVKKTFFLDNKIIKTLPYSEKIIYLQTKINLFSPGWLWKKLKYCTRHSRFLWQIQNEQRNSILNGLKKFQDSDLVIFGDLDEIPSESALDFIKLMDSNNHINTSWAMSCDQLFYYYHINNCSVNEKWYGSIVTQLSFLNNKKPHKIRGMRDNLEHISNGGWHFSYFMNAEQVLKKINAIADVEKISEYKKLSISEIQLKISNGEDLFNRGIEFSKPPPNSLPKNLIDLLTKYLPNTTK